MKKKKKIMTIFLIRNIILCRPWLHYYGSAIDWRIPWIRWRFPRKVPSDCRTVHRHRHGRPRLSSAWSSPRREITAIYGRQYVANTITASPSVISPTRPCPTIHTRATTPYVDDSPAFTSSRLFSFSSRIFLLRFHLARRAGSRVAGETCRPPELFLRETRDTLFLSAVRFAAMIFTPFVFSPIFIFWVICIPETLYLLIGLNQ